MADKVAAGPVGGANGAREAVCIHTKKIYSSCRDKDCIEDLRFYPTATAQSVLSTAQGLRGGSAELIYTFVDVEPVNFNRGYYTVDMHFFLPHHLTGAQWQHALHGDRGSCDL